MSYLSKVGIVLSKADFELLVKEVDCQSENTKLDIDMIFASSKITSYKKNGEDFVRIMTRWIKWYENDSLYPGVDFIMEFIDRCKHDYIRFGEDFGDYDEHYDHCHICPEVNFYIQEGCTSEEVMKPAYLSDRYKERQKQ